VLMMTVIERGEVYEPRGERVEPQELPPSWRGRPERDVTREGPSAQVPDLDDLLVPNTPRP
jgi:hypothetical protein